ncbi:LysM peptidoglycan-binding domain-containing protein [Chelatococcus reniformis]|uniref:LysM domain-containing protein n=1 Tax=Chelatococcus reniformis TaxID=1494448 RepID=A0A916TZ56_9HYPH|nr:LysM domain-containing protein [Chelatococcus reniformis]GGC53720.1 hypothetical protein GCM10010994_10890 [Chelatococcus reniformis]
MARRIRTGGAAAALLALAFAAPPAQAATSDCPGGTTTVERGDTLSSIAARCDVAEAVIIAANPAILGSGDLQIGSTVRASGPPAAALKLAKQFNDLANDTATALGRIAGAVDTSLRDLVDRNPDLKSRLERFAGQLGVGDAAPDAPRPEVTAKAADGGAGLVRIAAKGLPKESAIVIGAGPPQGAYAVLTAARTSAAGTLDEAVRLPDWMAGPVVFVLRDDANNITARSDRYAPGR